MLTDPESGQALYTQQTDKDRNNEDQAHYFATVADIRKFVAGLPDKLYASTDAGDFKEVPKSRVSLQIRNMFEGNIAPQHEEYKLNNLPGFLRPTSVASKESHEDPLGIGTARGEYNQLAAFLANRGGPDTKAAKAFQKAVESEQRRQAITPDERAARAAERRDKITQKSIGQAQQWATAADLSDLEYMVNRGNRMSNGRNYLFEAAQAELTKRNAADTSSGHLDLYHRTTPEAAQAIHSDRSMTSRENTGEAYFSTFKGDEPDAQGAGYGTGVVHVRVPEHLAELDDEFPSGEQHYRVKTGSLKPEHFITPVERPATKPIQVGDMRGGWKVLRVFPDGSYTAQHETATRHSAGRLIPVRKTFKPSESPASASPPEKSVNAARVRSLPPEDRFSGVHSETHRGERLSVRRHPAKNGYLQSSINGHVLSTPIGRTNKDAVRELDSLKSTVDAAHERPEAYSNADGPAYGMKL